MSPAHFSKAIRAAVASFDGEASPTPALADPAVEVPTALSLFRIFHRLQAAVVERWTRLGTTIIKDTLIPIKDRQLSTDGSVTIVRDLVSSEVVPIGTLLTIFGPGPVVLSRSTIAIESPTTAAIEASSTTAIEVPTIEASSTTVIEVPTTAVIEASSTTAIEPPTTAAIEASSTTAIEPLLNTVTIPAFSTNSSSTTAISSSTTTASLSQSTTSSPKSLASSHSSGISTGAKAGIAIGIVILCISILLVIFFYFQRRGKSPKLIDEGNANKHELATNANRHEMMTQHNIPEITGKIDAKVLPVVTSELEQRGRENTVHELDPANDITSLNSDDMLPSPYELQSSTHFVEPKLAAGYASGTIEQGLKAPAVNPVQEENVPVTASNDENQEKKLNLLREKIERVRAEKERLKRLQELDEIEEQTKREIMDVQRKVGEVGGKSLQ